jgi:hypothetical protein
MPGVIGTYEMAELILSKRGDEDVNHEAGMLGSLSAHGNSPAKMITLMVKVGADPSVLYEQAVPLVEAIRKGRADSVKALMEANDWVRKDPKLAAAKIQEWTKIEKEVVYLFLGPGGIHTLDPSIKPRWIAWLVASRHR